MKAEDISGAMNNIQDGMVDELYSEKQKKRKKVSVWRYVAAAACALVTLDLSGVLFYLSRGSEQVTPALVPIATASAFSSPNACITMGLVVLAVGVAVIVVLLKNIIVFDAGKNGR